MPDGYIFLLHCGEVEVSRPQGRPEMVDLRLFTNVLTHGWLGTRLILPWIPSAFVKTLEQMTRSIPLDAKKRVMTHMGVLLQRPLEFEPVAASRT